MDVMLLQEFRGLEQILQDQLIRFLRARLHLAGFETLREDEGGFLLKRGSDKPGVKTVLAVDADLCADAGREAELVVCAALLRVMDEAASRKDFCGELEVTLSPRGQISKELCSVHLKLDPALPFGTVEVSGIGSDESLAADCLRAAEVVSAPQKREREDGQIRILIGYAQSGSPYRIHPLAMEHVADVMRELLRLRHASSY